MKFKEILQKYNEQFKALWNTGKIQRTSRMTYDVAWNIILFFLVIGFIGIFFGMGIGAGYFASLVKDEPIRTYASMEKDIYNIEETSKLYFAEDIYIGDVRSDLHREKVTLEDISPTLINAVIATEDELFVEHNGVVPKAIIRAIAQEVLNSDTKSGGSTLTQQIIKNQILTNEVSFERKAKEILLALRLERFFSKEEILESYLNIIPYGRDGVGDNIAGIQTAAQGVFGIDAKDLSLPQAAYLAGLPQSPSTYTPFLNSGGLKDEEGLKPGINRMKTVLNRMHTAGYITDEEYDEALDYDIVADFAEKKTRSRDIYPALTEEIQGRSKNILVEVLAKEDGYSLEDLQDDAELLSEYTQLASRGLEMNGYHIHSTIDKEVYDAQQEAAKNFRHYGPDREVTNKETGETYIDSVQTGAMLIENSSGRIISFVGSRGFSEDNQLNFATGTKRPPGSTIKPLLDYAPAMEKGVVQPGSVLAAYSRTFNISGHPSYPVNNYGGGQYGLVSAREALAKSYNVPAVETYTKIINDDPQPAEQYLEKMGITSLTENDKSILSLSLGAMDYGMSVEENTNAFSTFANHGQFVDGYMIEKITTSDGKIVYEHEPEPVEVFSPQTAYLTIDMMRDVLSYGTAASLKSRLSHSGVDWAGKTGTSDDYKDAWFIASNPNVTFGTWIGYDSNLGLDYCPGCSLSYSQRSQALWAELINAATAINPELFAPQEKFQQPDGIVSRSYCATSGMLPSELCEKAGLVSSDIYNANFVPTQTDDSLISSGGGVAFNPEWLKRNGYNNLSDLSVLFPRTNRELWERIGTSNGSTEKSNKDNDDSSSSNKKKPKDDNDDTTEDKEPKETDNELKEDQSKNDQESEKDGKENENKENEENSEDNNNKDDSDDETEQDEDQEENTDNDDEGE